MTCGICYTNTPQIDQTRPAGGQTATPSGSFSMSEGKTPAAGTAFKDEAGPLACAVPGRENVLFGGP